MAQEIRRPGRRRVSTVLPEYGFAARHQRLGPGDRVPSGNPQHRVAECKPVRRRWTMHGFAPAAFPPPEGSPMARQECTGRFGVGDFYLPGQMLGTRSPIFTSRNFFLGGHGRGQPRLPLDSSMRHRDQALCASVVLRVGVAQTLARRRYVEQKVGTRLLLGARSLSNSRTISKPCGTRRTCFFGAPPRRISAQCSKFTQPFKWYSEVAWSALRPTNRLRRPENAVFDRRRSGAGHEGIQRFARSTHFQNAS